MPHPPIRRRLCARTHSERHYQGQINIFHLFVSFVGFCEFLFPFVPSVQCNLNSCPFVVSAMVPKKTSKYPLHAKLPLLYSPFRFPEPGADSITRGADN
jgi:hypothetical protein